MTNNEFSILLQIFFGQEEEEIQNRTKSIDSLKTALRTQPMRYVIPTLQFSFNFHS